MEGDKKQRRGRSPKSGKKVSFVEEKALKAQTALEEAKRREALKETLRLKLEFEQKALRIVVRLLEDEVTDVFLTDCARFITLSNYRDAVEERSIAKMCGYPVCPDKLGSVPKQQFKISTKTNKVYDITERKCFCSNFCYKASKHFEVQISKTPLWLREKERPLDVKLLKKGESGSSGEEVKISERPIKESEIENPEPVDCVHYKDLSASGSESESSDNEQDFVSSVVTRGGMGQKGRTGILKHGGDRERNAALTRTDEGDREKAKGAAQGRSAEITGNKDGDRQPEREEYEDVSKPQPSNAAVDEHCSRTCAVMAMPQQAVEATADMLSACRIRETDLRADNAAEFDRADCPAVPGLNITQVGMSRRGAAELRSLLSERGKDPGSAFGTGLLERLRRTLREWRTEETLLLLHGAVHTPREEDEELDEDDLEDSVEAPAPPVQDARWRGRPSAAAPEYDTLHRETKLLNLRVQEFYRGSCVLPEENKGPEDTSGWDPALPLVDSHAQHLIQKRIVSEKLNRSLRDIVGPLQLTMNDISTDINNLVRTFSRRWALFQLQKMQGRDWLELTDRKLHDAPQLIYCGFTNSNIIHKSPEWTLIAVVLLSVLSTIVPLLKESLEKPSAIQYISTLMGELRLADRDLQSLVQLFRIQAD